jgi:hypothetical protein
MNSVVQRWFGWMAGVFIWLGVVAMIPAAENPLAWPVARPEAKPRAYWWWMASAVDTNNLARELARYQDAGLGGVHIIPIYGAKGWESNYISYLSPKWMEMLDFTVTEAKRLGLEVDMTTGTGWCFGGPKVTDEEANASLVVQTFRLGVGERIEQKLDPKSTQALVAFGPGGKPVDMTHSITPNGEVFFSPPGNWQSPKGAGGPPKTWTVYALSQKPSGQKVKRAAPGGEGWMLNLAYPRAMTHYLQWFDAAFANYQGAKPRAQYHDSYEYKTDWSPVLLAEFERRRGYRLQDHLDAFITGEPADRAARVKCDYRETISDLLLESTAQWAQWSRQRGFRTRNEAHGSPGNWLDLYAAADIPETEMFYKDRNKLISKFASSAAHVAGKPLVAAETGTWLAEHFTETLADMKFLVDDLFLSGVNHVFYHGTCYSPDEAPWPGWVFYASYEMNPRNAVWHDVAALNAYVTRCQSVLQAGQPDHDLLLYWPIHDFWSNPAGTTRNLTVHARDWFEEQPIGQTAEKLWQAGYQYDYVSDRQLARAKVAKGGVRLPGGTYRTIVVPASKCMPQATLAKLVELARSGTVKIVFVDRLPSELAGLAGSEQQAGFDMLLRQIQLVEVTNGVRAASFHEHHKSMLVGPLEPALAQTRSQRESLFDSQGLMCIRRAVSDGRYYFIANRGEKPVDGWVPLATLAKSVAIMDPMTGQTGAAASRQSAANQTEVHLNLPPGASVILRTLDTKKLNGALRPEFASGGATSTLAGRWQVKFLSGGPELPASFETESLASWTSSGDTNAASFAGTALYSLIFDAPDSLQSSTFQLDLGRVCQSARVRLNGRNYGTLFTPPFRVVVDNLKTSDNLLEVEVTSTSANRIRDLDRRGVKWQNFYDINFVNLNYQKFNAAEWPVADAGLLGPVTLAPVVAVNP